MGATAVLLFSTLATRGHAFCPQVALCCPIIRYAIAVCGCSRLRVDVSRYSTWVPAVMTLPACRLTCRKLLFDLESPRSGCQA